MRSPPPLSDVWRFPLTATIALGAMAASALFWGGQSERLVLDARAWRGEPWRFLTSTLAHGDLIHLGFNLAWLWVFGTLIEESLGRLRTGAILLYLAVVSAAAEFALMDGGIGLSGVIYGLFGMLWALESRARRFADAVDTSTKLLFVGWFVFCAIATHLAIMNVGNIAHASGAAAGLAAGWMLAARARIATAARASLALALLGLALAGATVCRPVVNVSPDAGARLGWVAYQAMERGDYEEGVALYRQALEFDAEEPDFWHNLAVCYHQLGREDEMRAAMEREESLRGSR